VGAFAALAGLGVAAVGALLVAWLFSGFVLYLAAKAVKIENVTFGRSLLAVLAAEIVGVVVAGVLFFLPVINVILGIIAYIWVIKAILHTSWGKAIAAAIVAVIIEFIIGFVILMVAGASLKAMLIAGMLVF